MNSRPEAWLHQARNDLAMARLAREHGFLAQSCYYASQAAEKALKGALLELGIGTLDEAAVRATLTVLLKHRRDVEQALVHLRVGGTG